jgi:hypothetical protein
LDRRGPSESRRHPRGDRARESDGAIDLVETVIASGNALKIFPARNPVRHEGGLRERPVLGTRYILLYRGAREGLVYILTVRHEARSGRGL